MINLKDVSPIAIKNYYEGEVIFIDENIDGVVYVRIPEVDTNVEDADLAPCYPKFNYQFFRIKPQVGERVIISFERTIDSDKRVNQEKRYWDSLVISSVTNISYDPYYFTSSSNQVNGWANNTIPLKRIPNAIGLTEDDRTLSIRGRNNTDISLRNGELILRSGRHRKNAPFFYNNIDPAYIQIKHQKEDATKGTERNIIVQKTLPSKHIIKLTVDDLKVLIKVIDKDSKNLVTSFSKTFENELEMIQLTKQKVLEYQNTYERWEFRSLDERFDELPILFPNNVIFEEQKISSINDFQQVPSSINIVADNINLLSHRTNKFDLSNTDGQINSNTQLSINNEAQRMVMGENLIEFLSLIRLFLSQHVHPYHGKSPSNTELLEKINSFDLENLLNQYLRIN